MEHHETPCHSRAFPLLEIAISDGSMSARESIEAPENIRKPFVHRILVYEEILSHSELQNKDVQMTSIIDSPFTSPRTTSVPEFTNGNWKRKKTALCIPHLNILCDIHEHLQYKRLTKEWKYNHEQENKGKTKTWIHVLCMYYNRSHHRSSRDDDHLN